MRLRQLVKSGLLGGMPQNMNDPTQVWRGLSATLGSNPGALNQFLAAGQGQSAGPVASAPELVSEHGAVGPAAAPAMVSDAALGGGYQPQQRSDHSFLGPDTLGGASHRTQLNALAAAKAVAKTMQHLRKLRPYQYRGPH